MKSGPLPGTPEWDRWRKAGEFIHRRGMWAWFVTLTFRFSVTNPNRAIGLLRGWLDALAKRVSAPVLTAYAVERHVLGPLHVHALVELPGDDRAPTTSEGDLLWRHGFARIRVFDPTRGGAWYIAKCADAWDLTYGRPSKHAPRAALPPALGSP